jgi:hypothetical protein
VRIYILAQRGEGSQKKFSVRGSLRISFKLVRRPSIEVTTITTAVIKTEIAHKNAPSSWNKVVAKLTMPSAPRIKANDAMGQNNKKYIKAYTNNFWVYTLPLMAF